MNRKDSNSLALLPNGFVDILPPQAQREADYIRNLMDVFSSFGYRRIKPPLLEFEDSLLAPGPGAQLASETFRVMDPVTHRMMGVRSDVTPQITRIVSSRLLKEARPLRLSYVNDVLRTRGSQMRSERQFTQVGCELVGQANCVETDVEICMVALIGLHEAGIKDITLDLTIPGFLGFLLGDMDGDEAAGLRKLVSQRDLDGVEALSCSRSAMIAQAMKASGGAEDAFSALENIDFDAQIRADINRLQAVACGVRDALGDLGIEGVSITVDLLEQSGFEYHKKLGFTLFSSNIRGEIGRGGCYDAQFGDGESVKEVAKGFTLYMDTIVKCDSSVLQEDRVFVSSDVSWREIRDLQKDGWIVIREAIKGQVPDDCTHMYQGGKVVEII